MGEGAEVSFDEVMGMIDANFDITETAFEVGSVSSALSMARVAVG